jgi:hypothetical protein
LYSYFFYKLFHHVKELEGSAFFIIIANESIGSTYCS